MYRLFALSTLILVSVSLPRRPRIYNVLISTKKNLSPSHAIPVYEPVLRTTSFGVAFPPYIYHNTPIETLPNTQNIQPLTVLHGGPVIQQIIKNPEKINRPELPSNVQSVDQIALDQYIPLNRYPTTYLQQPYVQDNPENRNGQNRESYQYEQNEELQEKNEPLRNFGKYYENLDNPKQVIANFKKNPEIPDVPPPPLPVKNI